MLFSTKTEYGVRALAYLAAAPKNAPVPLPQIADEIGVSLAYLEQLFAKLKKAELVRSEKGVGGGYLLARPAATLDLLAVIEALEGRLPVNQCLAGADGGCHGHCLTRQVWVEVRQDIEKRLKKYKIKDLVK